MPELAPAVSPACVHACMHLVVVVVQVMLDSERHGVKYVVLPMRGADKLISW